MSIALISIFFKHGACLRMKHSTIVIIVRPEILNKKISQQVSSMLKQFVGLIFTRIQNCSKDSIIENVGRFKTLRGIKIGRFPFCRQ